MADLLVTGTDTGVGKTVIAAGLVLALRARGERAIGFKPVETGLSAASPADSKILFGATGLEERDPLAVPLLRLREPLAPAVAVQRAGTEWDPRDIEQAVKRLRSGGYRVVVEGAGGLLTPIGWSYTMLDVAAACRLHAVVVGRAGLGTLNHVMLTLGALQARRVRVAGIVLNGGAEPAADLAEETNPAALRRLVGEVPVIVVPRFDGTDPLGAAERAAPLLDPLLG